MKHYFIKRLLLPGNSLYAFCMCSDEISIGDEVWTNVTDEICGITHDYHFEKERECVKQEGEHWMVHTLDKNGEIIAQGDMKPKFLFRVIGEISSKSADKVEVNDEFDRNEFECVWENDLEKQSFSKKDLMKNGYDENIKLVINIL